MAQIILGISAFYHDSAAALISDGEIIAAAQEERFSRIKNDAAFPTQAIRYLLTETGYDLSNITAIVFYDKPFQKFERLLETYHAFAPKGLSSFLTSLPVWIHEKIFMRRLIKKHLQLSKKLNVPIYFSEHHLSHAASAFYPSPYEEAAILTIDGVGEWATTTIGLGNGKQIKILKEIHFPHSLGLLYSAFTFYLGFKVNDGEYKVMGLAPYGDPDSPQTILFKEKILEKLIDIREDGSFLLNMHYFKYATGLQMTRDKQWEELFGFPRRKPEQKLEQVHANSSLAIQQVTEMVILKLAQTAYDLTKSENLVMAGGVALNCVANERILNSGIFSNIWIQPAAGDAGGAIGSALAAYYLSDESNRINPFDQMKGCYLGPCYHTSYIVATCKKNNVKYKQYDDWKDLINITAEKLSAGNVVGWFQGRMEFGPRALGNRSILADPRDPSMQQRLNRKIKFRESFRPFAPCTLEKDAAKYFGIDRPMPYMLFTVPVKEELCYPQSEDFYAIPLQERLSYPRSDIPAVTHLNYSARVQTVNQSSNPLLDQLLTDFKKLTGFSVLINTSFNIRDEPIVCSPEDAIRCFLQTDMDYLVMENVIIHK